MARVTLRERLDRAMALDANEGTEHRGHTEVVEMLQKACGPKPAAPKPKTHMFVKATIRGNLTAIKPIVPATAVKPMAPSDRHLPEQRRRSRTVRSVAG